MKKILLPLALLLFCAIAGAQEDIVKTGYNFGPVPALGYDADKGFQVGALCYIYNYGDGTAYPNYNSKTYVEASFFTKGSQLYILNYDAKDLIPGVRLSAGVTASVDKAMDFYGFNGYRTWYDADRIAATDSYIFTPYYKMDRLQVLGNVDFLGNINEHLQWELGYHPSYFRTGAIDRASINKGKEESEMFPPYEVQPTLYEQYVDRGLISPEEAAGGFSSVVRLGLCYDSRDKEGAPTRGIWAEGHVSLAPRWLGTTNPFYRYSLTMRQYFPLIDRDVLTFAYRLNYEGNFGDSCPFYVLPYMTRMGESYDRDGMGGYDTVRGLIRDRVTSLDMATWTAEMRWRFTRFVLWKQNIAFGLIAFTDGTMVTRDRDMSSVVAGYPGSAAAKDTPHITAGAGLRFIMNENFILAFDYGLPISRFYAPGNPLKDQDGPGAFYINSGYLF